MKKKMKKILALVVVICLMMSALPAKAMVPLQTIDFDSLDEIRCFFALDEGLMVDGELKNVADYFPKDQMKRISGIVDTLVFPYLEVDGKSADFGADWTPENRILDIIYVVDEIQYRFTYSFLSEKDWTYEDGTEKDIRMGQYQLDFRRTDHPNKAYSYVSGFREGSTYLQVRVASNREDCLNFDCFSFVHLSDLEEEKQVPENNGWLLIGAVSLGTVVLAGVIILLAAKKRKCKVRENEQTSDE